MLRYVATNAGGVREAFLYLGGDVTQLDLGYAEVQASNLDPIVAHGMRETYHYTDEPVFVDDTGLFIDGFEGFPGLYSSYVEDTLSVETVHRLAAVKPDGPHRVSFRCVPAYCDGELFGASPNPIDRGDRIVAAVYGAEQDTEEIEASPAKLLIGSVNGRIVPPRGEGGSGYDPISKYDGAMFAEMSVKEKNGISRRGRTLTRLSTWHAER